MIKQLILFTVILTDTPNTLGYFLKKFFDTTEKVNNLISNGDISSLVSSQNWKREKHPMINNKQVLKTLYYVDRPETWEQYQATKTQRCFRIFPKRLL